jgi:hypothetical protein
LTTVLPIADMTSTDVGLADEVRDDLADMRTPGGLSAVFSGFDQLISSKPGVQGIAQFELQVCACEMMVSNLGVLPFDADFGDLRLEALRIWAALRLRARPQTSGTSSPRKPRSGAG